MGSASSIPTLVKIVVLLEVLTILAPNAKLDSTSSLENANNQTSSAASRKTLMESASTAHQVST